MNSIVYNALPEADREAVRIELRNASMGFSCACGALKPAHRWFCQGCIDRLVRAGISNDLIYGLQNLRTSHNFHSFTHFDRLNDALQLLRSGAWSERRPRQNQEAD